MSPNKEKFVIIVIVICSVLGGIFCGLAIHDEYTGVHLDINNISTLQKCEPPITYNIKLTDLNNENHFIIAVTRHTIINDSTVYICNWDFSECYEICKKFTFTNLITL